MVEEASDFDLVHRFVEGDESSFNKIVLRYQQKIYWHARRMTGNHLDADEIVQEVLIVLYEKLKGFKYQSSLYTWIYRITATRSINYLRKRNLRQIFSFDEKGGNLIKSKDDIVSNFESKERLERLESVLKEIPPKQREVFLLRNFEELSYEEISEITGKSVGGLKANYFHALKKIMELMKEDEI